MSYSMKSLVEAYIAAGMDEWKKNIRDRQWTTAANAKKFKSDYGLDVVMNYEGDSGDIARIIRSNGGHWARTMRKRGYSEAKGDAWCGLFIGHCMLHMGNYLETNVCVDVSIKHEIAENILPSTLRISSKSFWSSAGIASLQISGKTLKPEDIIRGDIVCVRTGSPGKDYGDHYVIALGPVVDGKLPTLEGNGYGLLGDEKTWGEGVVVRDARHPELMRDADDIRRIYRFDKRHFEGLHL